MKLENLPPISEEDIQYFREYCIDKLVIPPDGSKTLEQGIDELCEGMDENLKRLINAGAYMITEAVKNGESEAGVYWCSAVAQLSTLLILDRVLEAKKLSEIYNLT